MVTVSPSVPNWVFGMGTPAQLADVAASCHVPVSVDSKTGDVVHGSELFFIDPAGREELLFQMVFGYMVVRTLLPLVRVVSRLPRPAGVVFAVVLNAGTRLFDVVNYWGSRAAALVFNRRRMGRKLDRTIKALTRRLEHESSAALSRSMPFPDRWDPFFKPVMTLHDVYAYPTQHFDFHAKQLNLRHPEGRGRT